MLLFHFNALLPMKNFLTLTPARKRLLAGLTFLLACSLASDTHAQAPGGGGPQPGGGGPTTTPLDGGASLLLASGIALGLRRLRRR